MSVRIKDEYLAPLADEARIHGFSNVNAYVNDIVREHLFESPRPPWYWMMVKLRRLAAGTLLRVQMKNTPLWGTVSAVNDFSFTLLDLDGFKHLLGYQDIVAFEPIPVTFEDEQRARFLQTWLDARGLKDLWSAAHSRRARVTGHGEPQVFVDEAARMVLASAEKAGKMNRRVLVEADDHPCLVLRVDRPSSSERVYGFDVEVSAESPPDYVAFWMEGAEILKVSPPTSGFFAMPQFGPLDRYTMLVAYPRNSKVEGVVRTLPLDAHWSVFDL